MTEVNNINEVAQQANNSTQSNSAKNDTQQSKKIILGCDTNQNDSSVLNGVYNGLIQANYDVEKLSIGPSPFSAYGYKQDARGKIGIYLMADSLFSYADGYHDLYDYDIFVIRGGIGGGINSQQDFDSKPLGKDADCNSVCDEFVGMTYPEMNEKAKGKCYAVYGGKTPEEALQAALSALSGQMPSQNSSNSSVSGTAVKIPDVTFYGLIKQIIGAIDGVFIIANNMAYLLSFEDMYKYRKKYEEHIPKINVNQIIKDSVHQNWTTSGYYNTVELTYKDGVIKCQYDALVQQYGENVFHYEFPNDDEETAKYKTEALLAAHIRDYSTDIDLQILYDPNITAGSWVKVHKSIVTNNTKNNKNSKKNIKRKKVNITNIADIVSDNSIIHVSNKQTNKTDITKHDDEYELFFVQGYTCKWSKKHSLLMNLHLKYGPDTPDDPINATIGTGQVSTEGNVQNGTASWGNDCFSICDICFESCRKVLPYGQGRREDAEEYIRTHEADAQYLQGRADQNSQYAKDVAGKTPQEAYTMFRDKFNYACYSDSCDSSYPCCNDLWTKTNAANCGDSTRMLKVLMDATGVPCYGIHVDGHYFNAVQVNGTWHTLDGTRGPTNSSCNFPDSGNYGYGGNDCGSGGC